MFPSILFVRDCSSSLVLINLYIIIMGNECNQCQPIPGCNREVVGRGLEKRTRLDLSRLEKSIKSDHKEKSLSNSNILQAIQEQKEEEKPKPVQEKENLDANIVNPLIFSTIELAKGIQYEGLLKGNVKHGEGKVSWSDGTILKAQFIEDKIKDKTSIVIPYKGSYEGQVNNNKAEGKGKLQLADGSIYEGQWLNDKPHGKGIHKLSNGAIYIGQFFHGAKCGEGKYEFVDGSLYEGNFSNDKFHGKGTLKSVDGREYSGQWKNGIIEGEGEMIYDMETKYVGHFSEGKRNGRGTYYFGDGRHWVGDWWNNIQNGKGEYHLKSGEVLEGTWRDGRKVQSYDAQIKIQD